VNGALTDADFERRVERLLESEANPDRQREARTVASEMVEESS